MSLFLFAAAGLPALPPELSYAWAEFSRTPMIQRSVTTVEVGTLGLDKERQRLDYWLRRTVVARGRETVSWTDSRSCPAVRPALTAMRAVALPRIAPPGVAEAGADIILDGVGYNLRAPADYGQVTVSSNMGTPLARWVDSTIDALSGCWNSIVPRRTGD